MKKRTSIITILLLVCGIFLQAQTYRILVRPVGEKLWKYANLKGEIVIDNEYPVCNTFSECGIAVVHTPKKNLYQLIDINGNLLETEVKRFYLKDAFGYGVKGYSEGVIIIKQGYYFGLMDIEGKRLTDSKFTNMIPCNSGYCVARIDDVFYIINTKGEETLVEVAGMRDLKGFSEGLAPFISKKRFAGFINTKGEVAIKAQFKGVGHFHSGLAWARTPDGQIGFINTKGEWAIKSEFLAAKDFDKESGMARVKTDDLWGYVNTEGEFNMMAQIETVNDFSEGLAKGRKEYLWGFYNNAEEWVIEPQFQAVRNFKNGFAAAKKDELWGLIDKQGNWVIQPKYAGIKDMAVITEVSE